jgi:hypothetical protein
VSSLRFDPQATVTIKPGHRGEHGINRKTIAQETPGRSGEPVVTTAGEHFYPFLPTRLRMYHARGVSCALFSGEGRSQLNLARKTRGEIADSYLLFEN